MRLREIKIGDFVRVKSYDELVVISGRNPDIDFRIHGLTIPSKEGYNSCFFSPNMMRYCGKTMMVVSFRESRDAFGGNQVKLSGANDWVFIPEMLDPVAQEIPTFDDLYN